MDYETFKRIKKGNGKALEALIDAHLKKAWFISFQLTEHVCRGAPLLIKSMESLFGTNYKRSNRSKRGFQRNSP